MHENHENIVDTIHPNLCCYAGYMKILESNRAEGIAG